MSEVPSSTTRSTQALAWAQILLQYHETLEGQANPVPIRNRF
jgi:hypothetical protein